MSGLPKTPGEAAKALQIYGQEQYKLGKYDKAIEAFSRALELDTEDISILDNRAAVYCKLSKLQIALADGKQIIKLDKTDARGYFRTGQVLRLMRQPQKALKIYEYALRTLPEDNPACKRIEECMKAVKRSIYGPTILDPFKYFPPELSASVLLFSDLKTRLRAQRVSKHWRMITLAFPELWRDFNLSVAKRKVSRKVIASFLRKSNNTITSATVANLQYSSAHDIHQYFFTHCPHLEHLTIKSHELDLSQFHISTASLSNGLKRLRSLDIISRYGISPSFFYSILKSCSRLESFKTRVAFDSSIANIPDIPDLPNLSALSVTFDNNGSTREPQFVPDLCDKIPNMETLNCFLALNMVWDWDLSKLRHLKKLGACLLFSRNSLFCRLPESLLDLSLTICDFQCFEPASVSLPNLTAVNLSWMKMGSPMPLPDIFSGSQSSLKHVSLDESGFDKESLTGKLKNGLFESVEYLSVRGHAEIDDSWAPLISKSMPKLKNLNLSLTSMSDSGIKYLVNSLSLETLVVHDLQCNRPYNEAVQFARSRGITVPTVRTQY